MRALCHHARALAFITGCLSSAVPALAADNFLQRQTEAFRQSDIVFGRADSNVPFPPMGFLGASYYGDAEVEGNGDSVDLEYDLHSISQAAALPLLPTSRDAVFIGEYLSYTDFKVSGADVESFDIKTVGLPVGWLRQQSDDLQIAAFVMPMGHDNSLDDGGWTWQTLGGGFARWVQHDNLWWAFGAYFDIAPDDNFYIPYIGASWQINERWSLSAIMPWPSLLYAPDQHWLVRLGASPSAASWSVSPDDGDATLNLDAWDFGLGIERRLSGNFWVSAEAGIGGLRGLRFSDDELETPDVDVGSSGYVSLSFKFRPSVLNPATP